MTLIRTILGQVLDKEQSYGKKLISEMFFIKRQSLNLQEDPQFLPDEYLSVLSLFPKI